MSLFSRCDGTLVKDASPLRKMLPHLMVKRNEAAIYFDQRFDVTATEAYLERVSKERSRRLTFFHVVLCAIVRTLARRPQLHRFVVGRRLYQRRNIELSFAVKKEMNDDAGFTTVKVEFDPDDTLEQVADRVDDAIAIGRGKEETGSEKEMSLLTRLPRFLLAFLVWIYRVADYFNLLPCSLIRNDQLYASAFLANLGSIGLDAPYHHMYETGTIPLFVVIGRIKATPVLQEDGRTETRRMVEMRYTFDERIADGFYCAKSLEIFRAIVEDPTQLEN